MDRDEMTTPLTIWSGLDLPAGIERAGEVREAVRTAPATADSPSGDRYELLALASRTRPAAFLGSLHIPEGSIEDAPPEVAWHDDLVVTWSLLYRWIAETAPKREVPFAIYVLGVNAPVGLGTDELDEFNDFYTKVHLPEVAERRHCLRASRYELARELRSPKGGGPQFLAVYELDEAAAQVRKHVGGPYSRGPEVWQGHTTPWRFWYRTLGS